VTGSQVEVVLYHVCDDREEIVSAYHESSRRMAGTPGLLENKLLTAMDDPRSFVVVSVWQDWAAFAAWESGAPHKNQTAPLRPFRELTRKRPFEIYNEVARYAAASARNYEAIAEKGC
jgi:heme oxygenase (mycobilin-producing)